MILYIDIALAAIVVISIIYNLIRGFVKALRPFRKVLALVLAWTLKTPAAVLVREWLPVDSWEKSIYKSVYGKFGDKVNEVAGSSGAVSAESYNGIFGWFENIFSEIKEVCAQAVSDGVADVADTVADFIASNSVTLIAKALAFIGLFVIFRVLFFILGTILEKLCSGKNIIGYVNRGVGALMGAFVGLLIAWGISFLIGLVSPEFVEQTVFVNWLYNDFLM